VRDAAMPANSSLVPSSELAVVHLVSESLGVEHAQRFLEAYVRFDAGADHELVIVHNGIRRGAPEPGFVAALSGIPHRSVTISRNIIDMAAMARAARMLSHRFVCFVNATSEPYVDGWLGTMMRHARRPDVGMVGATASWGTGLEPRSPALSAAMNAPLPSLLRHPWRRRAVAREIADRRDMEARFRLFPNPHIRANGFVLRRDLMLALHWPEPRTKRDAHALEHGRQSLTVQIYERGLRCVVVARDANAYESDRWPHSKTFWIADQENLLIGDRRTRDYATGSADWRRALRRFAWGDEWA
jgi:hypothetical protein